MYLRFRRWLRRWRSNHHWTLQASCSGSHCCGGLLTLLRGDLCLRLPRRSILKVGKRSCENISRPLEEDNFSIKLRDYF